MLYFRHFANLQDLEAKEAIILEHGVEGYGRIILILEIICAKMKLPSDHKLTLTTRRWCQELATTPRRLNALLISAEQTYRIKAQKSGKMLTIDAPNLLNWCDEYSRKLQKKSGQGPGGNPIKSVQNKNENSKSNKEREEAESLPSENFIKFASDKHKRERGQPLSTTPKDKAIIDELLAVHSLKTLEAGWDWFLQVKDHPWLEGKKDGNLKPRTFPIFGVVLPDFLSGYLPPIDDGTNRPSPPEFLQAPNSVSPDESRAGEQAWTQGLEEMQKLVLPDNFLNWLKPLQAVAVRGSEIFLTGDPHHLQVVKENYNDLISEHCGLTPKFVTTKNGKTHGPV